MSAGNWTKSITTTPQECTKRTSTLNDYFSICITASYFKLGRKDLKDNLFLR